ncbi:MAG: hypothetical protein PHZ02_01235 [Desulfocapsaceae bacterium]|nr:hypothetical protein [Desulfocapsaceae bacterium]
MEKTGEKRGVKMIREIEKKTLKQFPESTPLREILATANTFVSEGKIIEINHNESKVKIVETGCEGIVE